MCLSWLWAGTGSNLAAVVSKLAKKRKKKKKEENKSSLVTINRINLNEIKKQVQQAKFF